MFTYKRSSMKKILKLYQNLEYSSNWWTVNDFSGKQILEEKLLIVKVHLLKYSCCVIGWKINDWITLENSGWRGFLEIWAILGAFEVVKFCKTGTLIF